MRLYLYEKRKIVARFEDYTFAAREKVLDETRNALATEVYEGLYDLATRVKMNALPDGWLPVDRTFYVNAGGFRVFLNLKDRCRFLTNTNTRDINIVDPVLIGKIQKWAIALDKFTEERNNFRHKMHSFLGNITTDKKLFEAMPEAKEILGESFFGVPTPPCTELITTAKEILCEVAQNRGEEREGCCNGKLIEPEETVVWLEIET